MTGLPILPEAVEAVLAGPAPPPPERWLVEVPSLPWSVRGWGSGRPVVLLHGVTSWGGAWWRIGPALAAAGFAAIAPDMPGHGETPPPASVRTGGAFTFADAAGLVAELVEELGQAVPGLAVIGHSWGAMTAAHLPAAGLRLGCLVLLDPPIQAEAWGGSEAAAVRRASGREEALALALEDNPAGTPDELGERAQALLHLDPATARAVFTSAPWDGALAALESPQGPVAGGMATWLVRGDPTTGAFVPNEALPRYAALLGADHVLTIAGGSHVFPRTHARETVAAILQALGS